MGLNRKNGTLKGVTVIRYNSDIGEYEKTGAVGWHLSDGDFFIGVGEREEWNGYDVEIEISAKALKRFLGGPETPKRNLLEYTHFPVDPSWGAATDKPTWQWIPKSENQSTSFSDDPKRERDAELGEF